MRPGAGRGLLIALTLSAFGAPGSESSGAAPANLDLFQRIARSELVVRVRVREGALRFALVEVERVIKGEPPGDRLRIAFRDFNFDRPAGVEPIVFPDGQDEILFLVPYMQVKRKEKNKDIYELLGGAAGRITVPAEGSGLILDAIDRLAGIAAADPAVQMGELRGLLGSDNPYLVEAALDEVERMMAATPDLYPRLTAMLSGEAPSPKRGALRLLRFLFEREGRDPEAIAAHGSPEELNPERSIEALVAVQVRARNDERSEIRRLAVLALAAWPDRRAVEADLRAVATQDPDQSVRYEAKRALVLAGSQP